MNSVSSFLLPCTTIWGQNVGCINTLRIAAALTKIVVNGDYAAKSNFPNLAGCTLPIPLLSPGCTPPPRACTSTWKPEVAPPSSQTVLCPGPSHMPLRRSQTPFFSHQKKKQCAVGTASHHHFALVPSTQWNHGPNTSTIQTNRYIITPTPPRSHGTRCHSSWRF